ncbi:MAG: CoA ester lyase [Clostridiales bacterium]|nr:CoA ester lyase [Clostridiales bacterium]
MRRSMLFLPGNTPNLILNGDSLGADAIILDLEDAVAPDQKDAARVLVRNALKTLEFRGIEKIIRINSLDTPYWKKDLDEMMPCRPELIMTPKTSCAEDVLQFDAYMSETEERLGFEKNSVRLMPLIETALGVENAYEIASASDRVVAIFLGAEDLSADLRCERTKEGKEIFYARGRIVMAARAAGKDAFDTPFTDVNDDEGIRADAALAKALGFTGKASISPRHLDAINEAFSPSEKEIDYAYEVLKTIRLAEQQGRGAVALLGKMIDKPIVMRAQQTIKMAEALGLGREDE